MSVTNWRCPYCGQHASLTENSVAQKQGSLVTTDKGRDGDLLYFLSYVVCPNGECRQYTLRIDIFERIEEHNKLGGQRIVSGKEILRSTLIPRGKARPLPEYIPKELAEDYREACLILEDSPKASAALSRRCLQGIIRRFYGITKNNLFEEVRALKGRVSPALWEAIDAIRKVGNAGAHFDKDVNVIVEITAEAANALVRLIELLFDETYIKGHNEDLRIENAVRAAKSIDDSREAANGSEEGNRA